LAGSATAPRARLRGGRVARRRGDLRDVLSPCLAS